MNNIKKWDLTDINSFLLAVLICIPMGSFILKINNIIPFTNMIVLLVAIIINKKRINIKKINIKQIARKQIYLKNLKNEKITVLYISILLILLLFNMAFFGISRYTIERILYFIVFGLLPCITFKIVLTADKKINIEKLIKNIIYIFAIMGVFLININFWNCEPGRRMSVSYYILPLFIAIILQISFYDKAMKFKKRFIKYLLYIIVFFVYIKFYVVFASRGALVSVFICALICFISVQKNQKRKIWYIAIGIVAIIILLFNLLNILNMIDSILKILNIDSRTIERTIDLLEENNMGNGRDNLYINVISGIKNHPLIGNGIGMFYKDYGTYPHNIILQAWHEGGVLYMIAITLPIIYSVYLMMFDKKIIKENKILLILFFSISIVRLMMSYEYWKDNYFWVFLYMVFVAAEERRRTKNGNSNNSNI